MKGDFSRRTHDPRKHYSAVLHEQGRVLTDADFDEEHRILSGARETATADLAGVCGAPLDAAGFAVTSPNGVELRLSAGRYYAGGMLVVNEEDVPYDAQPDRVGVAWPPPEEGRYAIHLDVWHRLVTALDDPSIREVALGGPTTAARERTVWQARHSAVPGDWTCASGLPDLPATTGRMAARAVPGAATTTPCLVPPLAGYTGLENQLYRVEVLVPGAATDLAAATALPVTSFPAGSVDQVQLSAADAATLGVGDVVELVATGPGSDPLDAAFAQVADVAGRVVTLSARVPSFAPADAPVLRRAEAGVVVSRENGSVVTTIEGTAGAEVTVADLGPDTNLGFTAGQWVELTDDAIELEGLPRQLRQIEAIDTDRRVVTLRQAAPAVDLARHPKLRRWDAARAIVVRAGGGGWLHLENGIEVRFTAGRYVSGDHWGFPARAAVVDPQSGTIAWPSQAGAPAELPPAGVAHHRCPLAVVDVTIDGQGVAATEVVDDCRALFPPATRLRNLLYVGGDGQEARRGSPAFPGLPAPLEVRVVNGGVPVGGVTVRFGPEGNGQIVPAEPVTDQNGLVSASWSLDPGLPAQTCAAHIVGPDDTEVGHQVVHFHATVQEAAAEGGDCCVCVGPGGEFATIEEAITQLLERGERDLCLCLTPGDHAVGDLDVDVEGRPLHLSIHGCGRATRVRVDKRWRFSRWASMRLADMDVRLPPSRPLTALGVDEVDVHGVHLSGPTSDDPLLRVLDAERVSVRGCVLIPRNPVVGEQLDALFAGVPSIEGIWALPDDEFVEVLRRAADELAAMPSQDRTPLADRIRELASDPRLGHAAAVAVLMRLADLLVTDPTAADVLAALRAVAIGAAAAFPVAVLEIGTRFDRNITDPAFIRPARIAVVDNVVVGDVSFYGARTLNLLRPEERKVLRERVRGKLLTPGLAGTVRLHGNRLGRLLLSGAITQALRQLVQGGDTPLRTVYGSFLMTDNVLDGEDGDVLARHVTVAGNEFTVDGVRRPQAPLLVMGVTADSAIVNGNHGRTVPDAQGVAKDVEIVTAVRVLADVANLEVAVVS